MTEMYESSTIARLVEEQWRRWLLLTREKRGERAPLQPFPTVTVSRERGSGGGLIAERVAEQLGFVVFDSEIVDHVARSASVDRLVVDHMDEHSQRSIREWTERVLHRQAFSAQGYIAHLTKTILTIGEKGQAVIVGRGAHLILPAERCVRVRIIAPLEVRVQRLAAHARLPLAEAEALIRETDQQRAQFILEHFRQSDAYPQSYDLVLNTAYLDLDAAARLIAEATRSRFPHVQESRGEPVGSRVRS